MGSKDVGEAPGGWVGRPGSSTSEGQASTKAWSFVKTTSPRVPRETRTGPLTVSVSAQVTVV